MSLDRAAKVAGRPRLERAWPVRTFFSSLLTEVRQQPLLRNANASSLDPITYDAFLPRMDTRKRAHCSLWSWLRKRSHVFNSLPSRDRKGAVRIPSRRTSASALGICTVCTYNSSVSFEWDEESKAGIYFRKHGIRMPEAIPVFDDPYAITITDDESEANECRSKLLRRP